MRILGVGHALFAVTMIALGVMSLMSGDFAPIWAAVPKSTPARDILIIGTAIVSLISGVGLLLRYTDAAAAFVLFVLLLLWMALFKVSIIFGMPTTAVAYETTGETAVLVAAAWVLYASFAADGFAAGEDGVRLAQILYGLALVAFGVAHFAYLKLTASLVPAWLPSHEALAAFTGGTYIAAGAAILSGVLARLAATLVLLQIGLFTLLVWVPFVVAGNIDAGHWSEFVVSGALTAGAWVMADSYGGMRWLSLRAR